MSLKRGRLYQISAGRHEFYRIEGRIEESELITREYSQLLLEPSSFSLRLEQMRYISQPSQVLERGAGVARCETQIVIPVLETGSESTGQQQTPPPPQQQQQFKTEKSYMVESESRGRAGGALAAAIEAAAAAAASGGTTPCLDVTARIPNAWDWERAHCTAAAVGAAGAV